MSILTCTASATTGSAWNATPRPDAPSIAGSFGPSPTASVSTALLLLANQAGDVRFVALAIE